MHTNVAKRVKESVGGAEVVGEIFARLGCPPSPLI